MRVVERNEKLVTQSLMQNAIIRLRLMWRSEVTGVKRETKQDSTGKKQIHRLSKKF